MSNLVPAQDIERLVGTPRHANAHYGRAVSADQIVYILHSYDCKLSGIDLRDCPFSIALDRGIDNESWGGYQDVPIALDILHDRLVPIAGTEVRLTDSVLDAVCDQVAASIRAEILILSYTDGMTGREMVGAAIRDAKKWAEAGVEKFRQALT